MRYGLLDYLIWIVFLGSAIASLLNIERWEIIMRLAPKGQKVDCVTFSKDHRYVAMFVDSKVIRFLNFPSMKVVWESSLQQRKVDNTRIYFKLDGSEIVVTGYAGAFIGGKNYEAHARVSDGKIAEFAPALRRNYDTDEYYSDFFSAKENYFIGGNALYRKRYPDGWTGHFYRPEVIATLIAGLALIYRIIRIRLSKG